MASTVLDALLLEQMVAGEISDSWAWAEASGMDHQAVVGAMKSLEAEGYLTSESTVTEFWKLTPEAAGYVDRGSPEAQLYNAIGPDGMTDADMEAVFSKAFLAFAKGKCMQRKWIAKDKATNKYVKNVRI